MSSAQPIMTKAFFIFVLLIIAIEMTLSKPLRSHHTSRENGRRVQSRQLHHAERTNAILTEIIDELEDEETSEIERREIELIKLLTKIEVRRLLRRGSGALNRRVRSFLGAEAWIVKEQAKLHQKQLKQIESARVFSSRPSKPVSELAFDECFTNAILRGVSSARAQRECDSR